LIKDIDFENRCGKCPANEERQAIAAVETGIQSSATHLIGR
jgi:hypothetical protein